MLKADNLSGLANNTTARSNLDVYSTTQVDNSLDNKADKLMSTNPQTNTSYVLVLSDAGKIIALDNALPMTVTIPPNSAEAFPIGTVIFLSQK